MVPSFLFFFFAAKTKATSSPMFERMIALETTTAASTKMPDTELDVRPIDLVGVWKMNLTEMCRQQATEEKEVRLDIPARPPWMQFVKLNIAFYAGLGIGTVFGMLIVCCISVVVSKYFTSPKNAATENDERTNRRNRSEKTEIFFYMGFRSKKNRSSIFSQEIAVNPCHCQSILTLFVSTHKSHDVQRTHFFHCSSSVPCAIDTIVS